MKIYVNGCSFSAGHQGLRDRGGKTWCQLFDQDVNVINDSLNGGSSFRALRMCIENVIANDDLDVVICQLSTMERGEMLIKAEQLNYFDKDIYISYGIDGFIQDYDRVEVLEILNQEGFKRSGHGYIGEEKEAFRNDLGETLEDTFHHKIRIFNDQMMTGKNDRELHILGLCNNLKLLCEAKGIKLLFTAIDEKCIPNVEHITPYFTDPISHIVGTRGRLVESETDSHPNEAGHEKIYRYIISELEKL